MNTHTTTEASRSGDDSSNAVFDVSGIQNAMTVDVEDYFQVSAFESHIVREDWQKLPVRVERNTDLLLDLFDRRQIKATFFTLGWVAQRFPSLVRRISDSGHEVGSHGLAHVRATEQTPDEFREDSRASRLLLEDVSGVAVTGYRAASFSFGRNNLWAHEMLEAAGYAYSSSIYPVRHDLYGIPEAPRFSFRRRPGGILEVPVTTTRVCGQNIPCGGGGYFRLLPLQYFHWAIRRVNATEGRAAVFYTHPWEVDPDQPRQEGLSWKSAFRHYTNLSKTLPRLDLLCRKFRWNRMDAVIEGEREHHRDAFVDLEATLGLARST